MQEGKPEDPDKTCRDWKPNACTAPGPGIEPGLSGAQRREEPLRQLLPQDARYPV